MDFEYNIIWPDLFESLVVPFNPEDVLWRPGRKSNDGRRAQALAYAESRVYEDRLNEVCKGDWSVTFKPWGDTRIICELGIHGVVRTSTGEFDDSKRNAIAEGTVAEAQAFKRACSKFGLGRYLYDIPIQWVDFDAEKNRLLETPKLATRFVPQLSIDTTPRLSTDRAEAMGLELEKLGYASLSHEALVEKVLGRKVSSLVQLSEAEALEIWSYAKRMGQQAA